MYFGTSSPFPFFSSLANKLFFFLLAGIYDLRLPNGGFKKGWILSSCYFQDFLTARIQVYLYTSKFFKDKKITQASRANAI